MPEDFNKIPVLIKFVPDKDPMGNNCLSVKVNLLGNIFELVKTTDYEGQAIPAAKAFKQLLIGLDTEKIKIVGRDGGEIL